MDQVEEIKTYLRQKGLSGIIDAWNQTAKAKRDGYPLFEVFVSDPSTAKMGAGWASVTVVTFKSFDIRQQVLQQMGGAHLPYRGPSRRQYAHEDLLSNSPVSEET